MVAEIKIEITSIVDKSINLLIFQASLLIITQSFS